MAMNTPIAPRISSADPLALMPTAARSAPNSKGGASFERHLDNNSRADDSRRPERDDDDRVSSRDDDARADAAQDAKDTKDAKDAKDAEDKAKDKAKDDASDDAATDTTATLPGATLVAAPVTTDVAAKDAVPTGDETDATLDIAALPKQAEQAASAKPQQDIAAPGDAAKAEQTIPGADLAGAKADLAAKAGDSDKNADAKAATAIASAQQKTAPAQMQAKAASQAATEPQAEAIAPQVEAAKPLEAKAMTATDAPAAEEKPTDGKIPVGLGHEAAAKLAQDKSGVKDMASEKAADARIAPTQTTSTPNAIVPTASASTAAAPTVVAETDVDGGQITSVQQPGSTHTTSNNSPTIRFGTLPGHPSPTQVPAGAIALQMVRNLQKGISRFDIRLDPAELGRIDVRMEVQKDGRVAAHMMVERPETLELLQRDASSLQRALSDAGLQTSSDTLNFSLRDQSNGNGAASFENSGSNSMNVGNDIPEETVSQIYNVNLSATGGIDIRV